MLRANSLASLDALPSVRSRHRDSRFRSVREALRVHLSLKGINNRAWDQRSAIQCDGLHRELFEYEYEYRCTEYDLPHGKDQGGGGPQTFYFKTHAVRRSRGSASSGRNCELTPLSRVLVLVIDLGILPCE
jgi:hypothetical protein